MPTKRLYLYDLYWGLYWLSQCAFSVHGIFVPVAFPGWEPEGVASLKDFRVGEGFNNGR